jgi:hypothetical protein
VLRLRRRRPGAPPAAHDGAPPAGRAGRGDRIRTLSLADRYLALAFRLAKHEPELVGNYYGPREAVAAVEAEEPLEPARLVEEASSLLADLARGDLEPQRNSWLAAHTEALLTTARRLAGERLTYADEVEGTFGIRPRWYDEADYERAHALLDEALPGLGGVGDRFRLWLEQTAIARESLLPALRAVIAELRAQTDALVGLPDGESFELELVSGERWFGLNRSLGGLRSRISINTDHPFPAGDLAYFVAHEGYPGHHADGVWKEHVLVRERGRVEVAMTMYGPQAVLSEGVAELAADLVLEDGGQELTARHLRRLGMDYDPEVGAQVYEARRLLRTVWSNVTLLLRDRGASVEEANDYARRWSLEPDDRVDKEVASLHDRPFPGYAHCYPEGHRLCAAFVRGDPARFKRLLVEQLVPADLS